MLKSGDSSRVVVRIAGCTTCMICTFYGGWNTPPFAAASPQTKDTLTHQRNSLHRILRHNVPIRGAALDLQRSKIELLLELPQPRGGLIVDNEFLFGARLGRTVRGKIHE